MQSTSVLEKPHRNLHQSEIPFDRFETLAYSDKHGIVRMIYRKGANRIPMAHSYIKGILSYERKESERF